MKKIDPIVQEKLEKLVGSMGYELVGCEFQSVDGRLVFRIYIDRDDGVTLDDCSRVSRQVSAMMAVDEPLQGMYTLEVSSPGIDRPLFEMKHYQQYVGYQVKVRLHIAINQRRQYKGRLQRVDEKSIYILLDGSETEVILPFSAIEKGNLIRDVRI